MLRLKVTLVVLFAALMGTLVILHTRGINGIAFYRWEWRVLAPAPAYLFFALASVPALAAQWVPRSVLSGRIAALLLLMIGCFAMKVASVVAREDVTHEPCPSLALVRMVVEHPAATSYYTDALTYRAKSAIDLLEKYPSLMPRLHLHSMTKAPGPILLWYALIKLWGDEAPLRGGLLIGVIATLSIPATYLLLRQLLDGDRDAAFAGASFLALCPGFVLFFPMFDPIYIVFTAMLIGFWHAALARDHAGFALATGLVLAAICMTCFSVLMVGPFMLGLIWLNPALQSRPVLKHALVAASAAFGMLVLLSLLTGYDPIATFLAAWRNQQLIKATMVRPWPYTIPLDLLDFALGAGWISVLLIAIYLLTNRRHLLLVMMALAQLLFVAVTGLLQLETARVWNFMLPLLLVGVGLELRDWPNWARAVCLTSLAFVTAAIHQNMKLIF